MDIRKRQWHAQLGISGVGQPVNFTGTIMAMFGEILRELSSATPRTLSDGHKEIVVRIRETPYGTSKSDSELEVALDVLAHLDFNDESEGPRDGETCQEFTQRLIAEGTPNATAIEVAASWFSDS